MAKAQIQLVGEIKEQIQQMALTGQVLEHYIKACRGRLAVDLIDPLSGQAITRILKGDTTDPDLDDEDAVVPLYTEFDKQYFLKENKSLIKKGYIVPHTPEYIEEIQVNVITETELEVALDKPFFAVKALLDKFTSPIPVERLLRKAKELNKTSGVIDAITIRLAELQEVEFTDE